MSRTWIIWCISSNTLTHILTVKKGKFVADWSKIGGMVGGLKFDVVEVLLWALHDERVLIRFCFRFGRLYTVSVWLTAFGFFLWLFLLTWLHFHSGEVEIVLLSESFSWGFSQSLSYFLALLLHLFLEECNFEMKLVAFCLKGNYLFVVELISTENLVVKTLGFFPLRAANVFHQLLSSQIHRAIETVD